MLDLLYQALKTVVILAILLFCHFANSNELIKVLDLNALAINGSQNQSISLLHENRLNTLAMDNKTLEQRAEELDTLSAFDGAQRQLNYYWLLSHTEETEHHFGKSAISKILQQRAKYLWQGMKEDKFKFNPLVPDSKGTARISAFTEYRLSVSEDDIEFALTYRY